MPESGVACYGVDGCRAGWFYAHLQGSDVRLGIVEKLGELIEKVPPSSRVFVDIPIGLHDQSGAGRSCDIAARQLLRPHRSSSVFNAPIRAILNKLDYAYANAESKRLSGKGLSRQTFNIIAKIREVDQLMAASTRARGVVREVHPELCFYGLAGCQVMEYSKKSREGFQSRLELLGRFIPDVSTYVESALAEYRRSEVAADDILDALVCAITAALADRWRTVPEYPGKDSTGLPMEIVYCRV